MKARLAILVSHPIQYYAPLFKLFSKRGIIDIRVFYSWGKESVGEKFDHGFGKIVDWDIPLTEGYDFEFLENTSKDPGVHHFRGINNPALAERVMAFRPDAILIFGWSFVSHVRALRYFHKKIFVYFRGDSTFIDSIDNWKNQTRKIFLRWIYSHVHTAFYVGENNYEYYLKAGMKPAQLLKARHAVDNNRFMQPEEEYLQKALEFRNNLNIRPEDFVFLFAGKFSDKKDPLLLLKAFLALEFASSVHVIFIGNGPLESALKELSGNFSNIHFLDFQNQQIMPVVYRAAEVFVLPSKGPGETWGLAINEAMACSRAILASDKCGGAIDLIENGVNGFIFKAGHQDELQEKMTLLVNDKQKNADMGISSLGKIRAFSYEQICVCVEEKLMSDKKSVG